MSVPNLHLAKYLAQKHNITLPTDAMEAIAHEVNSAFAAGAAIERELCAKVCDEAAAVLCPEGKRVNQVDTHIACVLRSKADEIRARGQA